ncbi:hypothetical protein L6164_028581 [Bauhinia variegata]|uniref:Uncharacterized protein n=1 Tax=Bauhinia variegata TaxID=167791 RepID=A0ACB9L6P2_BAUVA|nr:hypothetical protein L6164_028581 [Bauhinia variegata]
MNTYCSSLEPIKASKSYTMNNVYSVRRAASIHVKEHGTTSDQRPPPGTRNIPNAKSLKVLMFFNVNVINVLNLM